MYFSQMGRKNQKLIYLFDKIYIYIFFLLFAIAKTSPCDLVILFSLKNKNAKYRTDQQQQQLLSVVCAKTGA